MSLEPSSNVANSTHQNIQELITKIDSLQKKEKAAYKQLHDHEKLRTAMCDNENNTGQTLCCSLPGKKHSDLSNALDLDNTTAKKVKTSDGSYQIIGEECKFKQNGGETYSQQIVDEINRLTDERVILFETLTNMYANVQRDVSETRSDLVDQMTVVGVVEEELGNARLNLKSLAGAKNNMNRMAEINTYYGKRYQAHTGIMKMIIMICVPLLILAILGKKGIIGNNFTHPLAIVVIVVGGYFLLSRLWDLWWRDNMNYDEYDWDFDPNSANPTVYQYDKQAFNHANFGTSIEDDFHSLASDLGIECIGKNCCGDNMEYDSKTNKCVDKKAHNKNSNHAAHHARASDDAKKQAEAFDVMMPVNSSISYNASSECNGIQTTVRPYASDDENQYAKV